MSENNNNGIQEETASKPREFRSRRKGAARGREMKTAPVLSEPEKKTHKALGITGAALCLVIILAGIVYGFLSQQYKEVYFPNTVINGMDASGKTADEVRKLMEEQMKDYALTLKERNDREETIAKDSIHLHPEFDGTLEKMIEAQNPYEWIFHLRTTTEQEIETMVAYDPELLRDVLDSLQCMDESQVEKPEDAHLSDYIDGQGYTIIPETPGNEVIADITAAKITDAIINLQKEISLDEQGCYTEASIKQDNPDLIQRRDQLNKYVNVKITYQFGNTAEILDGSTTYQWLTLQDDYTVTIDQNQIAAYVKSLADAHDTLGKPKSLKTSYGSTVSIQGGYYGWRINQGEESAQILSILQTGESVTREPVYRVSAVSHGETDYGNTYVEINLTAQHLYFYKDGQLVVESDFVSGNTAKGMATPAGAYSITYKQRNATLKGQGYATPVSYWMPFNGGIGLHDANWRSTFGGAIYKTNGSHGCINLPPAVAKTIYENISAGVPVLCYQLAGTESSKSSVSAPAATSAAVPETTAALETTAASVAQPPVSQPSPQPSPEPSETTSGTGIVEPGQSTSPAVPETSPAIQETSGAATVKPAGPGDTQNIVTTTAYGPGV